MVDPPRRSRTEMLVLDDEQVRMFLAEAKRSSPHYRLYLTGVLTGKRQSELLGLRWKDLDLITGTAAIQQTFYRMGRQQIFKAPKTPKARRAVALPPGLRWKSRRTMLFAWSGLPAGWQKTRSWPWYAGANRRRSSPCSSRSLRNSSTCGGSDQASLEGSTRGG